MIVLQIILSILGLIISFIAIFYVVYRLKKPLEFIFFVEVNRIEVNRTSDEKSIKGNKKSIGGDETSTDPYHSICIELKNRSIVDLRSVEILLDIKFKLPNDNRQFHEETKKLWIDLFFSGESQIFKIITEKDLEKIEGSKSITITGARILHIDMEVELCASYVIDAFIRNKASYKDRFEIKAGNLHIKWLPYSR